jgi:hypothetical protein
MKLNFVDMKAGENHVKVKTRNELYPKQELYACYQPEFFTFEGQLVPTYKWCEPGTICMTTGDPRWPVRVIHPRLIVSVDDQPYTAPKTAPAGVVQVQGSKGAVYTVTTDHNGKRSCNCTGFSFRKTCRHIKND